MVPLIAIASASGPRVASACSLIEPIFSITEGSTTAVDLPAFRIAGHEVERGCGSGGGDCSNFGHLELTLEAGEPIDGERLGASIVILDGGGPFDASNPVLIQGNKATLILNDVGNAKPFEVTLALRAIDRSGRLGATSEPLHIEDLGGNCCCASVPSGDASTSAVAIAAVLFALRVRRRRAHI